MWQQRALRLGLSKLVRPIAPITVRRFTPNPGFKIGDFIAPIPRARNLGIESELGSLSLSFPILEYSPARLSPF
jgi:hypothetical protein